MTLARLTDAAHTYKIPERTLRHWITSGRVVEHRDGRRRLVDTAEVEQLLAQRNTMIRLPKAG